MSAPKDIVSCMAEFLRLLACEVENNQSLAKRLSNPFNEFITGTRSKGITSPPNRKAKAPVPEGFDPFRYYYEQGSVGLYSYLQNIDPPTCKAILSHFGLDPSNSYARWRKQEKLVDFIVQRVKAMTVKGEAFEYTKKESDGQS
ncbi:MAG: hypothetical protein ABFD08_13615 [Syntrophomonas sp.]